MDSNSDVSRKTPLSTQDPERFDPLNFRRTLNKSVINMFADLSKLTTDPQNLAVLSNFYKFIHCFRNCLEEFPQIFIICSANDFMDQDGSNTNIALVFTEWVMMRLLSVLSTPYPIAVHEGCEGIFVSLLQVVRTLDPPTFRRFCLRLLSLMSELNSLYESFCKNEEQKLLIHKYFSEVDFCLKGDEGLDLSEVSIEISEPSSCQNFQIKLTSLVGKLLTDMVLVLPDSYNVYWKLLCLQIEIGDLNLKEASLNAIEHCTVTEGLPNSEIQINYILDCLQALITFCYSQDLPEMCESFEKSVASCLTTVIKAVEVDRNFVSANRFMLISVLENLMQVISTSGISRRKCIVLHFAVIEMSISLLRSLNDLSLFSNGILRQFQVSLCSFLRDEQISSHEFLVPLFVFFVTNEVLKLTDDEDSIEKIKSLSPSASSTGSRAQIIKFISSISANELCNIRFSTYLNIKNIPYVWPSVLEILNSSAKNLESTTASEKSMLSHVNIVTSCLNILLQSSLRVSLKCPATYFVPAGDCHSDEMSALWAGETIHAICHNIFVLCSTFFQSIPSLFQELIGLCSCIISFQDFLQLTPDNYNNLCQVLSFPWMSNVSSPEYLDLQLSDPVHKPTSQVFVSNEVMSTCMQCLSHFPRDISPLWRCFVAKSCYESEAVVLKVAVVKTLPMLFHNGILPQTDIWKLHKVKYHEDPCEVQIEFSKIVGRLNCISHSNCSLYRCHTSDGSITSFADVYCNICDIGKPFEDSTKQYNSSVLRWLLNLFLHSVQHENQEVRKASITAIQSLFAHNPYDETLLCTIIQLVMDADVTVQKKFSSSVQHILKPFYAKTTSKIWTSEMDDILMAKMREGLHFAKKKKNLRLQESILSTVCEIGKVASSGLLLICVICLLENLLSSPPSIIAVARHKMQEIAIAKKYKMPELFKAFKEPICQFIAESLMTYGKEGPAKSLSVIQEVYVVFGYSDIKSFLNVAQQYILPYLVSNENDHLPELLDLFAKSLNTHKRSLLINSFPFIFSYLVRHCEKPEVEKALFRVQKQTELEFGSLLRCNYQHIHNELLLHISTHYKQVFAGLATLALKSGDQKDKKRIIVTTNEDMANYLQPKLLGFLVFFDSQLLKNNVTLDDKKLALQSLVYIIQLMGPRHITTVRFKIMATLRIAIRFKDNCFPGICCKAWEMFVQSIEMASLGPMINQVAVALLPLLDSEPEAVSRIMHFLIVENKSNLKEFFHDLYFIPDIPQLQDINEVLKEYTEDPASQSDFNTLLSHSLRGVSHENLEVRMHALAKLKQVLHSNQPSLHEHLLGKESVDHLLSNLISAIMPVCRESDKKARAMLADCLGALGAIDPGRLELKNTNGDKEINNFLSSVEDENFSFALLQELAHSFLAAADCRVQDCSAFAIQEVLRIYKFSDRKHQSGRSNNLWKRFPPDIQEILDVLSNSQYKPLERKKIVFPKPIYQSFMGNTFNSWVTNWFSNLITKVKHDLASKLFHSCSMISRYDRNCALFLLPHVIIYAIIDSTEEDCENIVQEILAVLQHCELSTSTSDLCQLSSQTIFSIFDHLSKWIRYRQQMLNSNTPQRATSNSTKPLSDPGYIAVNTFLSKIPQILLAKSSFNCHAYTRALMHLEQHLTDNPSDPPMNISFLQKLYAALDESDGVAGVSAIRIEDAALKDTILEHEATGDMQGAFACYEKAINIYPDDVNYYGGLLKCFIRMDQPSTALSYANGIIVDRPEWEKDVNSYRVEAAWKLASWSSLEIFLKNEAPSDKWNVGVGKILLAANNEDIANFEEQIKAVRYSQMAPLSAASMENGAYLRGYEHLTRLHMLTDIQQSIKAFWSLQNANVQDRPSLVDQVISEWKIRQQLIQSSLRHQEPIFDLHRTLLKMGKSKNPELAAKFEEEIASAWLKSAKLARKSGHQQRAYSCLLEAGIINSPALFMEKTKCHWNNLDHDQAILCLQKGIKDHFSISPKESGKLQNLSNEKFLMCAKAKLLLAVYSEESAIVDSTRLIQMYREIVTLQPQWEESHFHLAKYYDKMLPSIEDEQTKADVMIHICKNFGSSLRYGCKHVYHSLPRLLDIWFDMGSQVAEIQRAKKTANIDRRMESALSQLTTIVIPELHERLPLFPFMTAFPQMVSRICHSHSDISLLLQKIIAKVLVAHSQQAIWMMIAVSKSSYPTRVQRCKMIFQEAVLLKPELGKFIQDTMKLSDKLLELSNKFVKESTLSIRDYFPALPRMVEDRNFSDVMLPLQTQMIVTLPSGYSSRTSHNPFPFTPICIRGFHDTVDIFSSLQRPKKLTINGSDGKQYGIICKPKDDLRKDCRLMEFNNLVNRYLKSDPEARKRQLYIRTYAVVPLNEECGLIEWIPNLTGLRLILTKIYKNQGLYVTGREIKAIMPHRTASAEQKLSIFKNKFLPKFPPVFRQWFLSTFPDPTAWYLARLAYARTTAVMSMVGYIVGLGDRHGENILFDASCGDIVHVDLNCLFNKGETMECPECVPFRLTHNMVDAMGPTGYEGVFRKSCEATMKIMRNRTDALMSVLRPFIHDPLVEWSKIPKATRAHPLTAGELRNEMGLTHVKDIELRLKGIIKVRNKPQGLPLSIEGQVNYLIQEATDLNNLSKMYIGWTPYL